MIEPTLGKFLYITVRGSAINTQRLTYTDLLHNLTLTDKPIHCETRNRILIHAGPDATHIVCPNPSPTYRDQTVEVFSDGWHLPNTGGGHHHMSWYLHDEEKSRVSSSRSIVVEFIGREQGEYVVSWLELFRRKPVLPPEGFVMKDCMHRCPELDACINSSLWCDGINHCPSGYDESIRHCYEIFQLPALYLAFGFIGLVCLIVGVCFALVRACKRRRHRQARLKNLSSEASLFGDKEVIC